MVAHNDEEAASAYVAFISYSHRDRRWARWLHRALETYRPPRHKGSDGDTRNRAPLAPIFLDREELSTSSGLATSVRGALERSRNLIVICSPDAARSRWVDEEVCYFKSLGGSERIFCLVVAGDPAASAHAGAGGTGCFVPALRFHVVDGRITDRPAEEPLAADVARGHGHAAATPCSRSPRHCLASASTTCGSAKRRAGRDACSR